jgi:hypothetical protein
MRRHDLLHDGFAHVIPFGSLPGKVLGGNGILPMRGRRLEACATKDGGRDARPTNFS